MSLPRAVASHALWLIGRARTTALLVGIIVISGVGCTAGSRNTRATVRIAVHMRSDALSDSGPLSGISNISFDSIAPLPLKLGAGWRNAAFASLLTPPKRKPVYLVRYDDADANERYVADANADHDFTNDAPLTFRQSGPRRIADVRVELHALSDRQLPPGSPKPHTVAMQVVLAPPYAYARISEQRRGQIVIAGRSYTVVLRSMSRSSPEYTTDEGTQLYIDHDGDGRLSERARLHSDGKPRRSEVTRIDQPFRVGDRAVEVIAVDRAGTTLQLQPSTATMAAALDFVAPPLSATDGRGEEHSLASQRGNVVLLSFWSTECPFSEQTRPALNALARRFADSSFVWLAMARETDTDVLRAHLESHAMQGTVLVRDSAAWSMYNPATVTPLFYLLDRDGTVRAVESGATAMPALEALVTQLVRQRTTSSM